MPAAHTCKTTAHSRSMGRLSAEVRLAMNAAARISGWKKHASMLAKTG